MCDDVAPLINHKTKALSCGWLQTGQDTAHRRVAFPHVSPAHQNAARLTRGLILQAFNERDDQITRRQTVGRGPLRRRFSPDYLDDTGHLFTGESEPLWR